MLNGVVFGRRDRGGSTQLSSGRDMLMSRICDTRRQRDSMSIRILASVMRRVGWMVGDRVVLRPEENGDKWIVERVTEGGCKLAASGGGSVGKHGRANFTVSPEVLDLVFRGGEKSFVATLISCSGNQAVFARD